MTIILFLMILLAFYDRNFLRSTVVIFISGFVFDLIYANLIGFSSLYFLTTAFVIYLYRRRFSVYHLLFQLLLTLASDLIYSLIKGNPWTLKTNLVYFGCIVIIFYFINKIKARISEVELEL